MEIETYEIEDASSEASAMANDAVALDLINKLGLKGQESIINKGTVTRTPYRAMEAVEMLVYKALCDAKANLEDYAADAIPVRVLQVAAHAKDTGMFGRLEVWYPREAKFDDPVLVGIALSYPWKDHENESYRRLTNEKFYILARWGKTLLPFDKLQELAMKTLREKRLNALVKAREEIASALAAIKESTDLEVLGRGVTVSV